MSTILNNICETINKQSILIANHLDKAYDTGLGIQEETITDILLNNIQSEHEENFLTRKFSHKEEGNITGADWLWCIGEPGSWITFAVQAKITNIQTGRINHLLYNNGIQYSNLLNFSKRYQFIPKYTIYSKLYDISEIYSRQISRLSKLSDIHWSFSSISPKYIKHITKRNEKHYSHVLQYSIPWYYIFQDRKSGNTKIAEEIAGNLQDLYWILEQQYRAIRNQKKRENYQYLLSDNPEPQKMISTSIPLPVLYLFTHKISPTISPVSNVALLTTQSVNEIINSEYKQIINTRKWTSFEKKFLRDTQKSSIIRG